MRGTPDDCDTATRDAAARETPAHTADPSTSVAAAAIRRLYDAVLFDLDATLVDTESGLEEAMRRVLADEHAVAVDDRSLAAVRGCADLGAGSWSAALVSELRLDVTPQQLHDAVYTRFDAQLAANGVALMPGARELVVALRDAGVPIAIVTSSTRDSLAKKTAGHVALFAGVRVTVTVEDANPNPKPHPGCYRTAAQRLGVDICRCLAFEDSVPGVTAAVAAGATVVAVPAPGARDAVAACGAHVVLQSLSDLSSAPAPHVRVPHASPPQEQRRAASPTTLPTL